MTTQHAACSHLFYEVYLHQSYDVLVIWITAISTQVPKLTLILGGN